MKRSALIAFITITLWVLWGLPLSESVPAEELTVKNIFDRAMEQKLPSNARALLTMTLIDKEGKKRVRELRLATKRHGNSAKVFIRVLHPPDVRGTGFLGEISEKGEFEAFLYLPELRKSRRITTLSLETFMDSDVSYSDLLANPTDNLSHTLLGTESIGKLKKMQCYKIETIFPETRDEEYGKSVYWIQKDNYIPRKAKFYSRNGELNRQLFVKKIKKISQYWTPVLITFDTIETQHKTILEIKDIQYDVNIPDSTFTKRNLEKE